jgi:hypothetical protein
MERDSSNCAWFPSKRSIWILPAKRKRPPHVHVFPGTSGQRPWHFPARRAGLDVSTHTVRLKFRHIYCYRLNQNKVLKTFAATRNRNYTNINSGNFAIFWEAAGSCNITEYYWRFWEMYIVSIFRVEDFPENRGRMFQNDYEVYTLLHFRR